MTKLNRIALVTGGNKGIGFEVAKQLSEAGCTVILTARSRARGEEAAAKLKTKGADVEFAQLDVCDPDSIAKTYTQIADKYGRLDILINNAGIVDRADGPASATSIDAVEKTLQTNFLGPLRVTQAMLPLLKQSKHASIVNVSSGLGSLTLNGDENHMCSKVHYVGYCASKAALNMFTVKLAFELKDTHIKVNSADPGYTATDLNNNQGYQSIAEGSAETVRLALIDETGPTGQYSDKESVLPW
jgi:NAD(P)-dependent dehydrogenase (short-subunit alcohol dehydrogenase family)